MTGDLRQLAGKQDFWLAEKAGDGLRAACSLMDWLREQELGLSDRDSEFISDHMYEIIRRFASVIAYAWNNDECLKNGWTQLMFDQGVERFDEFQMQVSENVPNDVSPLPWVSSFQRLSDSISEAKNALVEKSDYKSIVREDVLKCARSLNQSHFSSLRMIGDNLLKLVDMQSVVNEITWPEFTERSSRLLVKAETSLKGEWEAKRTKLNLK